MRSSFLTLAGAALLIMGSSLPLASQAAPTPDSARLKLAREVITLSGADSAGIRGIEIMVAAQRKMPSNDVPPAFWDRFLKQARADLPALLDKLSAVYAERFTVDELRGLKVFFQSSVGKRMAAEQPAIQQASARIGMEWGAQIGAKVTMELMQEEE